MTTSSISIQITSYKQEIAKYNTMGYIMKYDDLNSRTGENKEKWVDIFPDIHTRIKVVLEGY